MFVYSIKLSGIQPSISFQIGHCAQVTKYWCISDLNGALVKSLEECTMAVLFIYFFMFLSTILLIFSTR